MLCIVGGGKMGSAIAAGLMKAGQFELAIAETNPEARQQLTQRLPGVKVVESPIQADGVVIAVKPKDAVSATASAIEAGGRRILSIAAGITLARLNDSVRNRVPIFRAMPNVGALKGLSATALCYFSSTQEEDVVWAEGVLIPLGTVVRVSEDQMDAVTGLSGSGPAYVSLVIEALIDAGVQAGLSIATAKQLSIATFQGVTALLDEYSPNEVREMVTTPAGTTAAGLYELEAHGVRIAFIDAVIAAAGRSRELDRSHLADG